MSEVVIEFKPSELQKIVEYLWKQPYGDVSGLIEIIKAADQLALAKLAAKKSVEIVEE